MLLFSQTQARHLSSKNYRVLLIIIDKNQQLVRSREFENVFEEFSQGSFVRSDGYVVGTR